MFGDPLWSLLGAAGLLAIEVSYLPQIARLYRLGRADEVSLFFPGMNMLGRIAALVYSLHIGDAVFGVGLLIGIGLRATLFTQVAWYRYLKERLSRPLERMEVMP